MSELACVLNDILNKYRDNTPSELVKTFNEASKAVEEMIQKEKEIEKLNLFTHLNIPFPSKVDGKEKEKTKEASEKENIVKEETFENDIPINGLFAVTNEEWDSIPTKVKGRLTMEMINRFIKIIDELMVKKSDLESRYFKLDKKDKNKVLFWKEFETKNLVGKKWIFQEDVVEVLPQKEKFPFIKYGMDCLRHCKRIQQTKNKGKTIIIIQQSD
uniref:SKA complex subunit 1 n=1 Tax=Strongyloides stercoralis TaxID=6248 RepID=A0A0K0DSR3_STRER